MKLPGVNHGGRAGFHVDHPALINAGLGQHLGRVQYVFTKWWEGCGCRADIQVTMLVSSTCVVRKHVGQLPSRLAWLWISQRAVWVLSI